MAKKNKDEIRPVLPGQGINIITPPNGEVLDTGTRDALREAQREMDEETGKQLAAFDEESQNPSTSAEPKAPASPAPPVEIEDNFKDIQEAHQNEINSIYDYIESLRNQNKEDEQLERQSRRAAIWTGAGKAAAAIANLIGVGVGNAVNQTYKTNPSDWMSKADAILAARRKRDAEIGKLAVSAAGMKSKALEAETKYKTDMMLYQLKAQREQQEIEYRKWYAKLLEAKTEAAKQEANSKLRESEKKLTLIDEQINATKALADSREASAYSSRTRANAQSSSVANQNQNRDRRTDAQVNRDNAAAQAQQALAQQRRQSGNNGNSGSGGAAGGGASGGSGSNGGNAGNNGNSGSGGAAGGGASGGSGSNGGNSGNSGNASGGGNNGRQGQSTVDLIKKLKK